MKTKTKMPKQHNLSLILVTCQRETKAWHCLSLTQVNWCYTTLWYLLLP